LCPPDSPDFYNTVIEIELDGTPFELLESTQKIERDLGRASGGPRNAPRIIDVDLLYVGETSLVRDNLVLPHPQLTRRRFVLQPLAEIRPELRLPGSSLSIAEHLNLLTSDEPALEVVQTDW
jgi:2-amino-4-hydroxy-6-hydroxymethyldihydropteridine diphosphokinase